MRVAGYHPALPIVFRRLNNMTLNSIADALLHQAKEIIRSTGCAIDGVIRDAVRNDKSITETINDLAI